MRAPAPARLAPLALLLATAHSQTFVVDAANGPGTNFTSIATAVGSVPSGSTLIVRAGNYAQFTASDTNLSILAEPGAVVVGSFALVTLTALANQRITVRGLEVQNGRILCANSVGQIHLEDIHFIDSLRLDVKHCSQVSVVGCDFKRDTGAYFEYSNVACSDSTFGSTHYGGSAVASVQGSTAQFARCVLTGGIGNPIGTPPGPGLVVDGVVRVLGPGSINKGSGTGLPSLGNTYAILGIGTVRIGANVTVVGGVPPNPPTPILVPIDEGSTSTTAAAVGSTVTGKLEGSANLLGGLMLGTTLPPTLIPDIAEQLWLNPFGFMTIGVLGAPLTFVATVPNDPTLRGAVFGWQGMTWEATAGFVLANPAWFCVQ